MPLPRNQLPYLQESDPVKFSSSDKPQLSLAGQSPAFCHEASGGITRRRWMGLSLGAIVLGGCTDSDSESTGDEAGDGATSRRRDVPLRVLLVGEASVAEAIEKSWLGVTEQPLAFTLLTLDEAEQPATATDGATRLVEAARESDVLLYPALLQGQLMQAKSLVPFSDAALEEDRLHSETLLAALRTGPMQYAKEAIAMPLGAVVPSLLIASPDWDSDQDNTWEHYQQRIAELPSGRAAEPLADGWAARMLLFRANTYSDASWLFDADTFRPMLMRPPFQKALAQMVDAAKSYPEQPMTPDEVWQSIRAGELDVAIGWPTSSVGSDAVGDVRVQPLPSGDPWYSEARQMWIDSDPGRSALFLSGDGLVASISARCRQTAVADRFIAWLSGQENGQDLRSRIGRMTVTRAADVGRSATNARSADSVAMQHQAYLRDQLSKTEIRTMLRIPAAHRYLEQLDAEVLAAIEGSREVEEALQRAVNAWETITIELGREEQLKSWRNSMGLRY